jgi:hypothetical protein
VLEEDSIIRQGLFLVPGGSGVKVQFSPVLGVICQNAELDLGSSLMPLLELWTGPPVQVQRGFSPGSDDSELRTGLPKAKIHKFLAPGLQHITDGLIGITICFRIIIKHHHQYINMSTCLVNCCNVPIAVHTLEYLKGFKNVS